MYKPDRNPQPQPHRPKRGECCTDARCESGLRNQYFDGKRLTAESFRVEQRYQLERRRLLNRAIHGWGVVYGYGVKVAPPAPGREFSQRLTLGAGLALDACGRELLRVSADAVAIDDIVVLDGKGRRIEPSGDCHPDDVKPCPGESSGKPVGGTTGVAQPSAPVSPATIETIGRHLGEKLQPVDRLPQRPPERRAPQCWLLSVHYAEQQVAPTTIRDPCSCERHEWDQVCETVRFSLRPIDCADCCAPQDCELQCDCSDTPCCTALHEVERPRQAPEPPPPPPPPPDKRALERPSGASAEGGIIERPHPSPAPEPSRHCRPVPRGGCACLCEHLTDLDPGDDCCVLCEIDEPCAKVRVDLRHGVPLACVVMERDECCEWAFAPNVEPCGPRRLVKRNDLLFDLIRGCDLTRISAISWEKWHRSRDAVPFDDFSAWFEKPNPADESERITGFWIEFSRPVREETLRPDCFTMRILLPGEEGWLYERRVPITDVVLTTNSSLPPHTAMRATIVVDAWWADDAVCDRAYTLFRCDEAIVEIEVFGDFIIDCNGQAVDANAVGLCARPTGNGTPGGTFRSSFTVAIPQGNRHARPAGRAAVQGA